MGDDEAVFEPEDVGELDSAGGEELAKDGTYKVQDIVPAMALVPDGKGGYIARPLNEEEKKAELEKERQRKEPWKVGVTDNGEDVYAPIAGPNAVKVLPLKAMAGVCKGCRCTVHRRSAYVDPWANIWCKGCWPYGRVEDPRDKEGRLPEHMSLGKAPKFPKIKKYPELPEGDDVE